jgi:hypothetical protein
MTTTTETRVACTAYDIGSTSTCYRQDAREITLGCLHEHVGPHLLCPDHVDDMNRGLLRCGACQDAGCECRLQLVAVRRYVTG